MITELLIAILIGVVLYQIYTDYFNRKKMFDIQIEMAKAQQATTKDMSWSDIKQVINDIVSFNVSNYILANGLARMKNEELSIMWTMILGELCTKIELSISDEVKRQALKSITEEYFSRFIKESVQITIIYQLETNRDNTVNARLDKIQRNQATLTQRLNNINTSKKG